MINRAILVIAVVALLIGAAMAVSANKDCQDRGGVYTPHSDRPAECVIHREKKHK